MVTHAAPRMSMLVRRTALASVVTVAVLGAASLGTTVARAQDGAEVAKTQALFASGVELMKQGKFGEACPKFEEVVRRTPDGIGAKLALAECYEGSGKLASAWGTWHKAGGQAAVAGQNERADAAKKKAALLEPRLSRLVIVVPAEVAALPGLVIKLDDAGSVRSEWGVALPVDGGDHAVSATATGRVAWSRSVKVAVEGARVEVAVPMLDTVPVAAPTAPKVDVSPLPPPPAPPSTAARGVPGWAIIVGGAGLAMLGAAAGFRVDQAAAGNTLDRDCGPQRVCAPGYDWAPLYDRENRSFGLFIGLGAGGIAAVSAAVIGILAGTRGTRAEATAAWTVIPAALPGQASGVLFTRAW